MQKETLENKGGHFRRVWPEIEGRVAHHVDLAEANAPLTEHDLIEALFTSEDLLGERVWRDKASWNFRGFKYGRHNHVQWEELPNQI